MALSCTNGVKVIQSVVDADFRRISTISWEVSQEDISLLELDDNIRFLSSVISTAAILIFFL